MVCGWVRRRDQEPSLVISISPVVLNSSRDFGKDIIPHIVKNGKAVAHRFTQSCVRSDFEREAYWRDVGTIDAYWQANIDLTAVVPELDIYDKSWPIWTYAEISPPAKFVHDDEDRRGSAVSSVVAGDCIISGASLYNSLLFTGVRANSYSKLECAVVLPSVKVDPDPSLAQPLEDLTVRMLDVLEVQTHDIQVPVREHPAARSGTALPAASPRRR